MDTMQGHSRVTISDVAKRAGVSIASVSRVIHGIASVNPDVRARVTQAIDALGYVPDRSAQILKTGRSNTLLHVVPDVLNPYYASMYRRLRSQAAQRGYQVMLFDTEEQNDMELRAIHYFAENGYDGMVFASIGKSPVVLDALRAARKPVVLTCDFEQEDIDAFFGIAGRGIYMAAKHLIDLGHRRVAYAGGPPQSLININRRKGYAAAMNEAGMTVSQDLIFEMDFNMDSGYRAGIYFSSIPNPPTAICAANDMIAMGVMQAMADKGFRIPDDVSLTGEDDIFFARMSRPPLSTIANSCEYAADHVLDMLLDRIEGKYTGPARIEAREERKFIVRASTAPPKSGA